MSNVGILLPGVLTYRNAGLTGSAMARATALSDAGVPNALLIHLWQPQLGQHVQQLLDSRRLRSSTKILSLYEELARVKRGDQVGGAAKVADLVVPANLRAQFPEFFNSGLGDLEIVAKWGEEADSVTAIEVRSAGVLRRRVLPDGLGNAGRVQEFNDAGEVLTDTFLDINGREYLRYATEADGRRGYTYVEMDGQSRWIGNKEDVIAFWLTEMLSCDVFSTIISELGPHALHLDSLVKIRKAVGSRVVLVLHSNHLKAPFLADSGTKPVFEATMRRIRDMDAFVVLTPQQAVDIVAEYGNQDKVIMLPHAFEAVRSTELSSPERDGMLAVCLGRVDPGKGQVNLVRGIAQDRRNWEGRRVEIWGSGRLVQQLVDEIERLRVGDIVKYMGFSDSPGETFGRAAVALFPNEQEAQPISIVEAMSSGAVPVSYDFKYGPRSMIKDGDSGFIVGMGHMGELLYYARYVMDNRDVRERLSGHAVIDSRARTAKMLASDWTELLSQIEGAPQAL